ncbi:hypothetical protein BD309DRAFT_1023227 [Dichomitus squalens]|uniref:Uncharacterized protein n=1 Tax=Dichomitus squalens TaxID=114155 RepID=A0A4Q9PA98_9APHY|nr:hypothetical protein BD311DRAFT_812543 [Dichomitus squalens]TBU37935.1 hypothetical protein BD309DRAFT_1023227 [Dichomitus squalens]TBU51368.1 hypothetical protein BD310DRAFT_982666 [Dichomitus squalens]
MPSLYSDNENAHSGHRNWPASRSGTRIHVDDVDALETPPQVKYKTSPSPRPEPEQTAIAGVQTDTVENAFTCRIPESPMPSKSLVQLKLPARAKAGKKGWRELLGGQAVAVGGKVGGVA